MVRYGIGLIGLLLPCAALAQSQVSLHASYDTYAAGIPVAAVESGFSLGPRNYEMTLAFHTTGMVGLFFRGHQLDQVNGQWHGRQAIPARFVGQGQWRGVQRLAEIDYQQGRPLIRQLMPERGRARTRARAAAGRHHRHAQCFNGTDSDCCRNRPV